MSNEEILSDVIAKTQSLLINILPIKCFKEILTFQLYVFQILHIMY